MLLEILRESLLEIRAAGAAGDAKLCADEANHVHNIPRLIRFFTWAKLNRYLVYARTGYTAEFQERFGRDPTEHHEHWKHLEENLKRHLESSTARSDTH